MITVKIKDGQQRPYLSTDQNHIQVCTTGPLGEQLRQVLKKSDQWSRKRCDNKKKRMDGLIDAGRSQYGLKNPTSGLGGDAIKRLLYG